MDVSTYSQGFCAIIRKFLALPKALFRFLCTYKTDFAESPPEPSNLPIKIEHEQLTKERPDILTSIKQAHACYYQPSSDKKVTGSMDF